MKSNWIAGWLRHCSRQILTSAISLAIIGPASATTWYVSPDGSDTNPGTTASSALQDIGTAVADAKSGDTITLEDGTYTGSANVNIFITVPLTINSVHGAASTVIDCAGSSNSARVAFLFTPSSTAPISLEGMTIKDGYYFKGGALSLTGTVLNVIACSFVNNYSPSEGGAIYEDSGSTLYLTNCTFSGNSANVASCVETNSGGLVATSCTFTAGTGEAAAVLDVREGTTQLQGCTISNNLDTSGDSLIDLTTGRLQISGCSIYGNSANQVIGNSGGTVTVDSCTFRSNTNPYSGGGIYGDDSGSATFSNCLVTNNSGPSGGAFNVTGQLALVGSTVSGNTTTGAGGAIYAGSNAVTRLTDDILWGDSANTPSSAEISNAGILFASYSDVQLGVSGLGNINVNPLFVNAASGNYKLQQTSPCLDKGTEYTGLTLDLAGRIRHNPPTMGAYEAGALWSLVGSSVGPDNGKRLLWVNTSGEAWLWTIPATGPITYSSYTPPATGNVPIAVAVGTDEHVTIAWLTPTGSFLIVNIAPSGSKVSTSYTPGAQWTLTTMTIGPDNVLHLNMQNAEGQALIWNISAPGKVTSTRYGPYN